MSFFSWYHLTHMHLVIHALESQRSIEEPNFTKRVIMGYLESKFKRGMPLARVDEKLTVLEQAMFQRRLPDFTKEIVEIRIQLQLPPSKVFPRPCRRSSQIPPPNLYHPPTNAIIGSAPNSRPTRPSSQPYLYLPVCTFTDRDDLPVYTLVDPSNPVRRLENQESLV